MSNFGVYHRAATRSRRGGRKATTIFMLLTALLVSRLLGVAEEASHSRFQVEAAFLFNFAKFVTWPPQAFPNPDSPLIIGVLGDDPLTPDLEADLQDKLLNNHPLQLLRLDLKGLRLARTCHILFIAPSEKKHLAEILDALKGASVLTVSRLERPAGPAPMINFVLENSKVRFQINDALARQAGLKISAKLLSLARHSEKS